MIVVQCKKDSDIIPSDEKQSNTSDLSHANLNGIMQIYKGKHAKVKLVNAVAHGPQVHINGP